MTRPVAVDAVAPFTVRVTDDAVADLRRRLRAIRWPPAGTVADRSQGVPLADLQDLCAYWAGGYDWRAAEARWQRLPQVTTTVDGVAVHAFHLRSPEPAATPLVLTHGRPGNFVEFEQVSGAWERPATFVAEPRSGRRALTAPG